MLVKRAALLLLSLVWTSTSATATTTWLFGAAACPPWKSIPDKPELSAAMAGACAKDIELFVDGFKEMYAVDDTHIITLIDEEATGAAVAAALTELAQKAAPEDRVLIYVNTHGGAIETLYKGYQTNDETFAWYTAERPEDPVQATAAGDWMTARSLRDLINQIMAEEIVTIIEACHADAALSDFINNVHNGIGGRGADWPGREAVIFSAHEEQIANFTPAGDAALFTQIFSETLKDGHHDTLFESFEAARLLTHRSVREHCAEGHTHDELVQGWSSYRNMCTQMPTAWDPFGLLDDIKPEVTRFGRR